MDTRQIIDYAEQDQGKEMRDAFYAALQDKVLAHIEAKKMEVAQGLLQQPQETETVEPEQSETENV